MAVPKGASTAGAGAPMRVVARSKPLGRRLRENAWGYAFLTPMAVLVAVFVLYPLVGSIRYAFYNWDGIGEATQFVGWRHFGTVARDKYFWGAFKHTVTYTVVLVPVQLTLALALALVLNNPRLRFAHFYRAVYFLAALQTVPRELYEAATLDGAGAFARFRYVTVPLIRPVGTIILFLAILGSLSVFDIVWVLNQGGPFYASEVVSTYIYSYAFTSAHGSSSANYGYASAAALFMSVLVLGVTALQLVALARVRRRRQELGN